MKKLKTYLDTSIISFLYADDSPEKQEITKEFFSRYLQKYNVFISPLVLTEIENTRNIELKRKLKHVVEKFDLEILDIAGSDEDGLFNLARKYVKKGIIPAGKFDDAMHIAICVYYGFDILLSWNFRHLANINKQMAVNAFNRGQGYEKELFLLNPMEVIYEKD